MLKKENDVFIQDFRHDADTLVMKN